jgi:hypothetical protein
MKTFARHGRESFSSSAWSHRKILGSKKSHDAIYRIVGIKQEKEGGKR